jgi:hypothetical protein
LKVRPTFFVKIILKGKTDSSRKVLESRALKNGQLGAVVGAKAITMASTLRTCGNVVDYSSRGVSKCKFNPNYVIGHHFYVVILVTSAPTIDESLYSNCIAPGTVGRLM